MECLVLHISTPDYSSNCVHNELGPRLAFYLTEKPCAGGKNLALNKKTHQVQLNVNKRTLHAKLLDTERVKQ